MEISFNELNAIAKTLPVGYYAKRRISVEVGEDDEASYYVPTEDRVVVSYPQVAETVGHIETDEEMNEMVIRSNLYHEISHAILTPMDMRITDVINIFEDERIETLLRNYYMNVDFKKMVVLMNGYKGEAPTNPMTAFYYCVRFRHYKPEFVARVDEIILKYKHLNRFSDKYYGNGGKDYTKPSVYQYVAEVNRLYEDIAKDFATTGGASGSGSASGKGFTGDLKDGELSDELGDGEVTISIDADALSDELSDKALGSILSEVDIDGIISDAFNKFTDTSLESALQMILENFRKKNSKGSAVNGYSGIINPRHCGRDDFKFFEKALSTNGNNSFGTLHLNLFIDNSGSFCYNEMTVNTLIKALSHIERLNRNFSLDLVFCGQGETLVTDKEKRFIKCCGGNYLDDEIYGIFRKLQKPNTYNYNIVLFDGDAYTDTPYSFKNKKGKSFSAFDKNNVTIISDYDNQKYIDKYVKQARVIYTYDYADELIANVKQTLEKAFR